MQLNFLLDFCFLQTFSLLLLLVFSVVEWRQRSDFQGPGDVRDPGQPAPRGHSQHEGGAAGRSLLDALSRRGGRQHSRAEVKSPPPQRDSGSCSPNGQTVARQRVFRSEGESFKFTLFLK